ncbi:MAG: DUF3109 family protein [Polaribacter sp.]|nr:DUF3109 family protein [Polaribacter sp.]
MIQIGKTIVSEAILENDFVCNLNACKGACCVEGEAGAPLEEEETKILASIFDKINNFWGETFPIGDCENMTDYLKANILIASCLQSDAFVSKPVREKILNEMLMPRREGE